MSLDDLYAVTRSNLNDPKAFPHFILCIYKLTAVIFRCNLKMCFELVNYISSPNGNRFFKVFCNQSSFVLFFLNKINSKHNSTPKKCWAHIPQSYFNQSPILPRFDVFIFMLHFCDCKDR